MMTMTTYLVPILGRLALVGGLSLSTGFCASREPESIEQLQRMVSSLSLSQFGTGGVGAPASSAIPDGIAEEAALTQRISTAKERAAQAKAQRTQLQQQLEEATRAQREKKAQLDEAKRRETRLANDLKWKKQELEEAQRALDPVFCVKYDNEKRAFSVISTREFLVPESFRRFSSEEQARFVMKSALEDAKRWCDERRSTESEAYKKEKTNTWINGVLYAQPIKREDYIRTSSENEVYRWFEAGQQIEDSRQKYIPIWRGPSSSVKALTSGYYRLGIRTHYAKEGDLSTDSEPSHTFIGHYLYRLIIK